MIFGGWGYGHAEPESATKTGAKDSETVGQTSENETSEEYKRRLSTAYFGMLNTISDFVSAYRQEINSKYSNGTIDIHLSFSGKPTISLEIKAEAPKTDSNLWRPSALVSVYSRGAVRTKLIAGSCSFLDAPPDEAQQSTEQHGDKILDALCSFPRESYITEMRKTTIDTLAARFLGRERTAELEAALDPGGTGLEPIASMAPEGKDTDLIASLEPLSHSQAEVSVEGAHQEDEAERIDRLRRQIANDEQRQR
ncbi:MAG: hypothetical protein WCT32_02195 [Patescibacteria group bacterium]|jgi:hypothetical protein